MEDLKLQPVENTVNGHQAKATESVELDSVTAAYLSDLDGELRRTQQATILQMNAAIQIFIRQHKLEGNWRLTPDGKRIERAEA